MNIAIANQFTKEAIKSRMLQHAANLWGVKNPNALDPFVRLLIEAFSTEVYRASNETQNIEGRILDKIARMLTPDLLTIPKPAHGILQAKPVEAAVTMHANTRFSFQKRIVAAGGNRNEELQLQFYPLNATLLINGHIAFCASGYQLFSFDSFGFKQSMFRTAEPLPFATCFLGLKLDKKVSDPKDVALYFDFPAYGANAWIYQLLPLVQVSYNGRVIETTSGIATEYETQHSLGREIYDDYDLMKKIHVEVTQQYNHKFITLKDCPVDHKSAAVPESLERLFSESQMQKIPAGIIWLELRFPPDYNYEVLSNCYTAINAFPVLNKNLLSNTYSYKGLNNILP